MAKKSAKSMEARAAQMLRFARKQAKTVDNWIDFHNAVFGIGGKLVTVFSTETERLAFSKTAERKEIDEMLAELMAKSPDAAKSPSANGRILLRVPKSIHVALLAEADAEGVSLNQLLLSKVSTQLRALV